MAILPVLLTAGLLALASCGPGEVRVNAAPLTASGDNRWEDAPFARRHEVMTFTVLPSMGNLFQRHRGDARPELACVTCHGEDAEAVAYRMPNGLIPLDPNDLPQTAEARWMAEVVTPRFDRMIRGGGTTTCFSCHARQGS